MDPLLILIQLEVLIQQKNYASRLHNPTFQFLIDPWIEITRMYIPPQIGHGEGKDSLLFRKKVFARNINQQKDPLTTSAVNRTNHTFTTKLYPLQCDYYL